MGWDEDIGTSRRLFFNPSTACVPFDFRSETQWTRRLPGAFHTAPELRAGGWDGTRTSERRAGFSSTLAQRAFRSISDLRRNGLGDFQERFIPRLSCVLVDGMGRGHRNVAPALLQP